MRKLKLQMQITVDGFVAGPEGQLDWMVWDPEDKKIIARINDLTDSSDTILMGRKMTPGFVEYWESVLTKPDSPEYEFARKMVNMTKVVFSRTVSTMEGKNVRVENGPAIEAIEQLKSEPGKDIIVYGGATFVRSLIEGGVIDEFNFVVNPVAIGSGLQVFSGRQPLQLISSTEYSTGEVLNTYRPR